MNKKTNTLQSSVGVNSRAPQNAHTSTHTDSTPNEYRLHLSHTMRICRYITSGILMLVILMTSLVFSEDINYKNASRLLSGLKIEFDDPYYRTSSALDFDSSSVFGTFRSLPVSFSDQRLTFFSHGTSADSVFDISEHIEQVLFTDSGVLLASERTVYIYNTSGLIKSIEYDEPFYGIRGSDEGFAVIYRTVGIRCAVDVYDRDADMIYKWTTTDKTVTDAFLKNGILTLTVIEDTDTDTPYKTIGIDTRTSNTVHTRSYEKYPLHTYVFADGTYCIVYSDTCEYYSASGEILHTLSADSDISDFYASDSALCILSDSMTLYITDITGKNTEQLTLRNTPKKIRIYDTSVFVIYPDLVEKISYNGEKVMYEMTNILDIIKVADDSFAVFSENEIKSLNSQL